MKEGTNNYRPGRLAIFYENGKPFELATAPVRPLAAGEILVSTTYTTLCGSDVHTYLGRRQEPPCVVLGHEIVGDILAIDPAHSGLDSRGEKIERGDRVIWAIFCAPLHAHPPRPDIPQKSPDLFKYGHVLAKGDNLFSGGLADYCIIKSNTALIKVSKDLPLKVAATISCAHATTAGALRVAGSVKDKSVLIFGIGMLGLSCVAMCKEGGASSITTVDRDPQRLKWATRFGATSAFTMPTDHGPYPWESADVSFDMTGDSDAMHAGINSLNVGGCAVWIGAVFPNKPVPVDAQQVVRKVLQIRGLHNYNYEDFETATAFIEQHYKTYPFEALIEKEYDLENIDDAFAFAASDRPVRVGIWINRENH
jgi:putative phosphonate catabolism associated alcohol dehydrogenase